VINVNNWIARANEILQQSVSTATAAEKVAFATSFLAAFYGPDSIEVRVFRQSLDNIERGKEAVAHRLLTLNTGLEERALWRLFLLE
jgi:hypothetical protein